MAEMIRPMRQKTGTAAQWASVNPVLGAGEIGIDTTNRVRKTGDGVRTWAQLSSEYLGDTTWSVADTFNRANETTIAGPNWLMASVYGTDAYTGINGAVARRNYNATADNWADCVIHRSNSKSLAQRVQLEVVNLNAGTNLPAFSGGPPTAVVLRAPMMRMPDLTASLFYGGNYIDTWQVPAIYAGIKNSAWFVYVGCPGHRSGILATDVSQSGYCVARGTGTFTGGGFLDAQIDADNILTFKYKGAVLWSGEVPSAPTGTYTGFSPGGDASTTVRNFSASNL